MVYTYIEIRKHAVGCKQYILFAIAYVIVVNSLLWLADSALTSYCLTFFSVWLLQILDSTELSN